MPLRTLTDGLFPEVSMPFVCRKISDPPILIFEMQDVFTVEDVREIYRLCVEFRKEHKYLYRISDLRAVTSTYEDMFKIMKFAHDDNSTASARDPHTFVVMVDGGSWARITREVLQTGRFGPTSIPTFHTQADALEYIRLHYALYRADEEKHED